MPGREGLPLLTLDRRLNRRPSLSIFPKGTLPYPHISSYDWWLSQGLQGNCKFGQKCALAHILPNGRRVNPPRGLSKGSLDLGGRIDPQLYRQSDPALAHSLLAQQANGTPGPFIHQIPPYANSEFDMMQNTQAQGYDIPSIDAEYTAHPGSKYGSPREDTRAASSPSGLLSVLDAPLPASFDSQGISYIARHGAVAASVPSKFGLEFSPPSSTPQRNALPIDSVRNIQSPPFTQSPRSRPPDLGSSPLNSGDESFGTRVMHSRRIAKPRILSASLPRPGIPSDDWDENFQFSEGEETDYIPTSLHKDILTPLENARRLSRNDADKTSPSGDSSKVGSPHQGSPSRYGALFARQQADASNTVSGSYPSAFGHVGSPLRNSSLHPNASPSFRPTNDTETSTTFPSFASPPRQSSMSILSQQLSRSRISSRTSDTDTANISSSTLQPPSSTRPSAPTNSLNRAVSAGSNGRIEEEAQGDIFSMEEEEGDEGKRWNGVGWEFAGSERRAEKEGGFGPGGRGRGSGEWGREVGFHS